MSDPTAIALQADPLTQRFMGHAYNDPTQPFDVPFISHIEGNPWQGGCANGLVLPTNIEHIVSLYPWEQYQITHQPKSYSLHWLYDDASQEPPAIVHDIAAWVNVCLKDGPTLVHCQAGLNRSSLIAGLALIKQGHAAADVIGLLREKRSPAVLCNKTFEKWLLQQ